MSSRRRDPRPFAAIAAVLLLALGGGADPCLAADVITVDVGTVYASNSGSSIDSSLSHIQGKLASMFNYSSYKLVDRKRRKLSEGDREEFVLPDERSMRIRLLSVEGKKVRLYIQIQEKGKKLLGTTLGLSRGGMVLVGGPIHKDGVLIFLISAD